MGRLGPLLTSQEPVFGNGLSGVESPGSFGPVSCPKYGICYFESVDYPKVSNEFQGSCVHGMYFLDQNFYRFQVWVFYAHPSFLSMFPRKYHVVLFRF